MMKLPPGVDMPEIPIETRYKSVTHGLMQRIRTIYENIVERFGDEGLDLIREISERYGRDVAERARKRIPSGSVRDVGLYLLRVFEMVRAEGEATRFDDEEVVIKVDYCPYPFTDPRVCEAHTTMERVLVEELGEGKLAYTIRKCIPRGDAFCEHVVHLKATGD